MYPMDLNILEAEEEGQGQGQGPPCAVLKALVTKKNEYKGKMKELLVIAEEMQLRIDDLEAQLEEALKLSQPADEMDVEEEPPVPAVVGASPGLPRQTRSSLSAHHGPRTKVVDPHGPLPAIQTLTFDGVTQVKDVLEAADRDGAVIVRGVPEYLVKPLSNLAPDLHDHPHRSRGVPVKTAQRGLFDAFRRQISFSNMTKKQQRAVKAYAHWMHSVGFPCEQIKLLVSFPGGVQQGVHIDSEMVSGYFHILAIEPGTAIILQYRSTDGSSWDHRVEVRVGDLLVVANDQPHAGVGYEDWNVRVHSSSHDHGIEMTPVYVGPHTLVHPRY